jgi:hypothetical protein
VPSGQYDPSFRKRGKKARLDVLRDMIDEADAHAVAECRYAHVGSRVFDRFEDIPEIAERCPACGTPTFFVMYFVPEPYEGWAEQRAARGPTAEPATTKIEALITANGVLPQPPVPNGTPPAAAAPLSARQLIQACGPSRRWQP